MKTMADDGTDPTREPQRRLYVRQEEGESDDDFWQRMREFTILTADPLVLSDATGPPTDRWSQAEVEEWVEAVRRTRPRWRYMD
jgi:hypothetical protein